MMPIVAAIAELDILYGVRRTETARAAVASADHRSETDSGGWLQPGHSIRNQRMNCSGVFERINQSGQTILMVTHSVKAAGRPGESVIKKNEVFHQVYKGELDR